jgi:hypothetical protein
MSAKKKVEDESERNRRLMEDLVKRPGNNNCADCGANGTRWASVNHGVFVCIRCSGIHRNMGTHISKVKSTNLDKWTTAEVSLMDMIGNTRGKDLYEAKMKGVRRPMESDPDAQVSDFIQRKYGQRAFATDSLEKELKYIYRESGYKKSKKSSEEAAAPAVTGTAVADSDDKKKDKKSKKEKEEKKEKREKKDKKSKEKVVSGLFGEITVPADAHDDLRAAVLAHFEDK